MKLNVATISGQNSEKEQFLTETVGTCRNPITLSHSHVNIKKIRDKITSVYYQRLHRKYDYV